MAKPKRWTVFGVLSKGAVCLGDVWAKDKFQAEREATIQWYTVKTVFCVPYRGNFKPGDVA